MDFYNDIDPYCCEVLRGRITEGQLPMGAVSSRDIRCLTAADLRPYRQVHLFAGIGGMALGLRLAGFTGRILTAGFPCQDISQAGRGRGLDGERSGLWWETLAAIDLVRPPLVLLENVAALLARGLDAVLGGLAEVGYDCQWHCVPAAHVGAPHIRDRIWIVAHPQCTEWRTSSSSGCDMGQVGADGVSQGRQKDPSGAGISGEDVAHPQRHAGTDSTGVAQFHRSVLEKTRREEAPDRPAPGGPGTDAPHPQRHRLEWQQQAGPAPGAVVGGGGRWSAEPPVGRVAHGVSHRVDRLRALGNAVVPQVVAYVAKAVIMPACTPPSHNI